jgi:serine/threonine protein kinase
VKIIDFGAVHVAGLAEDTREARAESILGALRYTAPEYFTGEGGSPQSDLFWLAVIADEMMTGNLPFGLQVTQVRAPADLHKLRYVPARTARRDLPAWIDAVLRQALHPKPAKRQEALSAFVHDLHKPGPQHLQHARAPLLERDPVRLWRSLALLLALALVVLLGLLAKRS